MSEEDLALKGFSSLNALTPLGGQFKAIKPSLAPGKVNVSEDVFAKVQRGFHNRVPMKVMANSTSLTVSEVRHLYDELEADRRRFLKKIDKDWCLQEVGESVLRCKARISWLQSQAEAGNDTLNSLKQVLQEEKFCNDLVTGVLIPHFEEEDKESLTAPNTGTGVSIMQRLEAELLPQEAVVSFKQETTHGSSLLKATYAGKEEDEEDE